MMENYDEEDGLAQPEDQHFDMPDFLGNAGDEENLFFDKDLVAEAERNVNGAAVLQKKANKKQVQHIRQAMMKLDKKIQRQQVQAARAADDEDDIVRNMTNLILHKNDETVKPWEKGMMTLDTAANSSITNVMRAGGSLKGKLQQKKLGSLLNNTNEASILLNPMVESFLSFNINNQTNLQTNANVTAHFNNQ